MSYRSVLMYEVKSFDKLHVIDIREAEELEYGKIPNAINLPLSDMQSLMAGLDKNTEYYIVCQSGSRSQMACQFLSQHGYKLVNVMGGMGAYRGALQYGV